MNWLDAPQTAMTTRAPAVFNINSNVTTRTLFSLKKKSKYIASRANDTESAVEGMDFSELEE